MKIDNKTLIMIGLGVGAYFLLTRNKKNKKCPAGSSCVKPNYDPRGLTEEEIEERDNAPCICMTPQELTRHRMIEY